MVLAEAPVSMNLQFSQKAVPTTVVRGGVLFRHRKPYPQCGEFLYDSVESAWSRNTHER